MDPNAFRNGALSPKEICIDEIFMFQFKDQHRFEKDAQGCLEKRAFGVMYSSLVKNSYALNFW